MDENSKVVNKKEYTNVHKIWYVVSNNKKKEENI